MGDLDVWSALKEAVTWPITHLRSSTTSSNLAHSFSDQIEYAHQAVDRTLRNCHQSLEKEKSKEH